MDPKGSYLIVHNKNENFRTFIDNKILDLYSKKELINVIVYEINHLLNIIQLNATESNDEQIEE